MEEDVQYALHSKYDLALDNESSKKWPVSEIKRLLGFYAAHRCLWDLQCPDNRNRKMRQAALIDIAAAMGNGFTKNDIVHKINVIRATYRYEKKRIKQKMSQGQGAKTKLKWFGLADAILRNVPKKSHRKRDPPDSDSDLECTVVCATIAEGFIPLRPNIKIENPYTVQEISENLSHLQTVIHADKTQSAFKPLKEATPISDDDDDDDESVVLASLIKPKIELLENEIEEQLKVYNQMTKTGKEFPETNKTVFEENKGNKENLEFLMSSKEKEIKQESQELKSSTDWNLNTTLQFIQQLKKQPTLWQPQEQEIDEVTKHEALNSIAVNMSRSLKSISKRLNILKETIGIENQKILDNPFYKPPYKWWAAVELLMESQTQIKTESIYLEENASTHNSSDTEENYAERFQNPIPSVAPMSNMNEAMASLFHEEFSLASTTNSSFRLETNITCESQHASKHLLWNTWEDDLLEGKWSLKHSVKFLRLYGAHRCLWDLNDANYRSRVLRNAAIEDIAASMGHGLTATYVAKKIKIFRITYMQQRKRILQAMEKGEKPDIMLKWFPLADSFLRPHIGLRSIKANAKEMPQFDFHYVYANLNLIDPALLNDFRGKGTQNVIDIGNDRDEMRAGSSGEAEY